MKRLIDYHLRTWKDHPLRTSLILRGARQVGKTYAVRELGTLFQNFVEINLESNKRAAAVFDGDLDPQKILFDLELITKKTIQPGTTLLFFDEIQAKPEALTALRYFYEIMPELHVVAAGSLLDFAIEKFGLPVGRIQSLYMYPVSFAEFLVLVDEHRVLDAILTHNLRQEMSITIHDKILKLVSEYLALGGMPQVLHEWQRSRNAEHISMIHSALIDSYRQDFGKYARQSQIKYVEVLFEQALLQLGGKFKYSLLEGDYRKRELAPALDLLVTAGVMHKVYHSSGQGIPLGAQIDVQDYKVISLDVGISQAILGFDIAGWFLNPLAEFVNKGPLVEAYVGQEILAYGNPHRKRDLYYWHKESRSGQAEVDFLMQRGGTVVPVEVKSGLGRTMRSMQAFLETHQASPYGLRFSTHNYSMHEKIHSYPLYAIVKVFADETRELKEALASLISEAS